MADYQEEINKRLAIAVPKLIEALNLTTSQTFIKMFIRASDQEEYTITISKGPTAMPFVTPDIKDIN